MEWKSTKDGTTLTFTKAGLVVEWDLHVRRYAVRRTGEKNPIEQGRTPHLDVPTFLRYVEMTWN